MAKINLDPQSEQSILNMLLDHSILNDSAVSKIVNTSKEIGKTKIETAIELKLTDEQKILKLLSSSYSLDIVDLNEKKIDEKIKKILDLRFVEDNHIVPFEISGSTLKIAIPWFKTKFNEKSKNNDSNGARTLCCFNFQYKRFHSKT